MQVTISDHSHEVLASIAGSEHRSLEAVLDDLIEERRRTLYFARVNAQYEAIRRDQNQSSSFDAETNTFEGTLSDGLNAA